MTETKCEQRSDEWFAIKLGLMTASKFNKLMPTARQTPVELNDTQKAILHELASEALTGEKEEGFTSKAMHWGNNTEDQARSSASFAIGADFRECGIYQDGRYGATPDAILMHDGKDSGVLELKCPLSKTHLKYLLNPEILFKDYKWQVLGQMLCTGLKYAWICSYDPRFKEPNKRLAIYEVKDAEADIELLRQRLDFLYTVLEGMKR